MTRSIAAPRVLLPGGAWGGPATIASRAGRIATVTAGPPADGADVMAGGALTPGLIDLHNNGAFGIDFAAEPVDRWERPLRLLAERGVTAVQPTVITAPLPDLLAILRRAGTVEEVGSGRARMLGLHLEGPFLAPAYRGAHRADWLRDPDRESVGSLLAAGPALRTVTLAPERPGAVEAVRRLTGAGVIVSLGHSDATAAEAAEAVDAGATAVTHLFNAMRPFRHRDPGLAGVALTEGRLFCGLIVDGLHVDPIGCHLAFAAKPRKIVAVSDSILVAGTTPGSAHVFGGMPCVTDEDGLGRRPDGTISGAGIVLDEGVRRMVAAGIDPARVLHAATEVAADAIDRSDLGRLQAGAAADLVWWDETWRPRRVWIAGEEVGR